MYFYLILHSRGNKRVNLDDTQWMAQGLQRLQEELHNPIYMTFPTSIIFGDSSYTATFITKELPP